MYNTVLLYAMLTAGILISVSSLDDLFIDLLALRIGRRQPADPLAQLPVRAPELPPVVRHLCRQLARI